MSDTQMARAARSSGRRADPFLLVLLALSLAANVYLGLRVSRLAPEAGAPRPTLLSGTSVPALRGIASDGSPRTLAFEGTHPVVLYVYSPTCVWCERNITNIRALAAARQHQYRFVGVSLSQPPADASKPAVPFDVIYEPTEESREAFHLGSTPQTIVVSPEGNVIQHWLGAYAGANQHSVERFFGLQLPGLASQTTRPGTASEAPTAPPATEASRGPAS